MRIASWNVNSIRARLEHLTDWLRRASPDVVCMQETKVEDEKFPIEALGDAGYAVVHAGQKSYNGVAIAARFGLTIDDVKKGLDGDDGDIAARLIAATIEGVRIVNVYVPNGQAVGTKPFAYKLMWLDRLKLELAARYSPDGQLLVCGDFNVAPSDIDVHAPKKWEGQVLCHPDERAALRRLLDWGLVDALRERRPDEHVYSWWDYRMGAFKKNHGLRIDLVLVTPPLLARTKDVWVDKSTRELERPSDHAPVMIDIE
ncbi:MAG: exodeoxyribonuclease III [Polyangiaceae bacterium]|nr:exodeoxyribonuclease III [Polyangiaceae bacterium]